MSWWRDLSGADFFFGFWGCLIMIGLAKGVVRRIVERKEDYYD